MYVVPSLMSTTTTADAAAPRAVSHVENVVYWKDFRKSTIAFIALQLWIWLIPVEEWCTVIGGIVTLIGEWARVFN